MKAPTARELAEAARIVAVLRSASFIPHKPYPKQAEFLALTDLEALYGGAAGGGKSDALLMGALQYVHVPGYSALLLRRTFRDLNQPDAIMARSHAWLASTAAKWSANDKRWTFPSGATLTFGYLDNEQDRYQYAGAALQFLGWDELTQFPEAWYLWMFSRMRRLVGANVPVRVRGATNPGGIGHEWVKRRFVDRADPKQGGPFIPAVLADNPSIDAETYRLMLAKLDSVTRAQLEHGVWVRDSEGLVYHFDEGRNLIDEAPECPHKVLALDFGATAPTSFNLLGWRDHDPTVYVLGSWKLSNLAPSEAAERIAEIASVHDLHGIVGDIGGLGKGYQLEFQRRFHMPLEPAQKNDKLGYIALFNGELERGLVKVVRGMADQLVTEWKELPWHESRTKEMGGFANHCADGVLYGWRKCMAFVERPKVVRTLEEMATEEERNLEEAVNLAVERAESAEWWDS